MFLAQAGDTNPRLIGESNYAWLWGNVQRGQPVTMR